MTDNQNAKTKGRSTSKVADAILAAIAGRPSATTVEVTDAVGLGRSTVTKALALLDAEGLVARQPGGRDGPRRLPDRWTAATAADAPADDAQGQRLGKGQLAGMVLDYLRANPGEHTPTSVAKALGGKSAGAVANALDKFTGTGEVVESCPKPRRYQAVG